MSFLNDILVSSLTLCYVISECSHIRVELQLVVDVIVIAL